MDAKRIAQLQQQQLDQATADATMRRMIVDAVEDGMVILRDLTSADRYEEPYPRLAGGVALVEGDEVLVAEIPGVGADAGSTRVVLDKLQRAAESVMAFDVPLVGQVYVTGDDGAVAETASNGDSTTFVTALTVAWPDLPDGKYKIITDAAMLAANTGGGQVTMRTVAGSTNGRSRSVPVDTVVPPQVRLGIVNTFNEITVAGGAGLVLKLQYRPLTAATTAYARNPTLKATAVRLSTEVDPQTVDCPPGQHLEFGVCVADPIPTPGPGGWSDTFVYGIAVAANAMFATWRNLLSPIGATESFELNTTARRQLAFTHPDSGFIANGFNAVVLFNSNANLTEWTDIAASPVGAGLKVVQGLINNVDNEWIALDDATAATRNVDDVINPSIALHATKPATIAYILADDLTNTAVVGRRAGELMDRIPELDVNQRPASPSFLGNNSRNAIDPDTFDIGIFGSGSYPSRWISTGVKRAEGDFTHVNPGDGTTDWGEWIRMHVDDYPNAHVWWWLQAHQLGDGSINTMHLSYPTPNEIHKQVWEAVLNGAKGVIVFLYQDDSADGNWLGLAHPASGARMAAFAEMSRRLTPEIRQVLLDSAPATALFTASGGGSAVWTNATFSSAAIGTLHDAADGFDYCVVCNRSVTEADVVINGIGVTGSLVSLETGVITPLGGSVHLGPLDGTIFRFVPAPPDPDPEVPGVPFVRLTEADNSVLIRDFWALHWMNPASPNHVPTGMTPTHPSEFNVTPGNLVQDAIDAAPNFSTVRLEPGGDYGRVNCQNRNGIHVISMDPDGPEASRPKIGGVILNPWDTSIYAFSSACHGWNDALLKNTPGARDAFTDPAHDFLFRDLNIFGSPTEIMTRLNETHCGETKRTPRNHPFSMMGIADVLAERCTVRYFRYSPNGTWPLVSSDLSVYFHHGLIQGTGGIENINMRDCEIWGHEADATYGWPAAYYLDGLLGGVLYNTKFRGKWHTDGILLLTNWDVQVDYDGDGSRNGFREVRDPKYVVIVKNELPIQNKAGSIRNGRHILVADNTWLYTGIRESFWRIDGDGGGGAGADIDGTGLITNDIIFERNKYSGGPIGNSGKGLVHIAMNPAFVHGLEILNNQNLTHGFPNGILTGDPDHLADALIAGNTP